MAGALDNLTDEQIDKLSEEEIDRLLVQEARETG